MARAALGGLLLGLGSLGYCAVRQERGALTPPETSGSSEAAEAAEAADSRARMRSEVEACLRESNGDEESLVALQAMESYCWSVVREDQGRYPRGEDGNATVGGPGRESDGRQD